MRFSQIHARFGLPNESEKGCRLKHPSEESANRASAEQADALFFRSQTGGCFRHIPIQEKDRALAGSSMQTFSRSGLRHAAQIFPLWAVTMLWAMDSPKP